MKKIIIIGGGVAGMSALWALHNIHEVTLLEAEATIGGHAYTHTINYGNSTIPVDLGVEYIHERLSPNFFELINQLGIPTYIAPMTFCAYRKSSSKTKFWSNSRLGGELNKQYFDEMNRFHEELQRLIQQNQEQLKKLSVGDFIKEKNFSDAFAHEALLPLLTVFSGCHAPSLDYSLLYVALSFNMNLLSFFNACYWRKISGGINQYLSKLQEILASHIEIKSPVVSVKKRGRTTEVKLLGGDILQADHVIFACQASIALKLLENPTPQQHDILDKFEYVNVESCLHYDSNTLHLPSDASEYFQFELAKNPSSEFPGYLTRVIKNLGPYNDINQPLYVSFDRTTDLDSSKIITSKKWRLPKLRPKDMLQKMRTKHIQGYGNLWYCGTDYTLTGHESALLSGLAIAERLGAEYPFKSNWLAHMQYNTIKHFMGILRPSEKVTTFINNKTFQVIKKCKLHKRFAHHFMSEMLF